MKRNLQRLVLVMLALSAATAQAYPLDGEESGIRRLEGYRLAQQRPGGAKLVSGQLWSSNDIVLHLRDYAGPDFDALEPDPDLAGALSQMLRARDPSYSMVLVDYSDPDAIRWAGLRPDLRQNPGSVGKLLCMAALFHTLRETFPDPAERAEVLRTAESRAGDWVNNEIHVVPKWDTALGRNRFSVINESDVFRLGEWVDHAISASANGAGTVVWREAMLVREFGQDYPGTEVRRRSFFADTPKAQLGALARAVITEPLIEAGIDVNNLQQGSFFTGNGKRKVPGAVSFATPRELARFLFRIEQGRLVDEWSSVEMKKYMYLTKRRYRYGYAPELADAAVFFKSGSLYSCQPEENFRCGKYMGNKQNLMNSVATIEVPEAAGPRYIAVLMSNVLRFNSAWDHSRIAAGAHQIMQTSGPVQLREVASEKEMSEAGRSD